MSDPTIHSVLDAYYFKKASGLRYTDSYLDIDELNEHTSELFDNLPGLALSDSVESVALGAERFLGYLLKEGCFHKKEIPFSRPVFRINQKKFDDYRAAYLKGSTVFNQSKDYPSYFQRAFEGYLDKADSEKVGEIGEIVGADVIASQNWADVEEVLQGDKLKEIRSKAIELASTIQQADLEDKLKERLLARTRAVMALLEAEDPEWPEIVNLLNYPYLTAFLNAYAILTIVLGLAS